MTYLCSVCNRSTPKEDAPEGKAGVFCPHCHCLYDFPPGSTELTEVEPKERVKAATLPLTLSDKQIAAIKSDLQQVYDSCLEGYDGTWDCATTEGKDAFIAMADDLQRVANNLGLELTVREDSTGTPA